MEKKLLTRNELFKRITDQSRVMNLTMTALAEKIGTSLQNLNYYRRRGSLSLDKRKEIADILEVDLDYLIYKDSGYYLETDQQLIAEKEENKRLEELVTEVYSLLLNAREEVFPLSEFYLDQLINRAKEIGDSIRQGDKESISANEFLNIETEIKNLKVSWLTIKTNLFPPHINRAIDARIDFNNRKNNK